MSWKQLSPYFAPAEVLSPDTLAYPHLLDIPALRLLNELRAQVGMPVIVNTAGHRLRGLRSAREQLHLVKTLGAARLSMHLTGRAFDVTIPGLSIAEMAEAAHVAGFAFVLSYPTFVHCDCRARINL